MALARPNDTGHHRLGLAVAKKHVPTAVRRNLIKRLTREQFRHLKPGQSPLDIVILTRPAARCATREQLRQALEQLFAKLGLETSEA
jgi:ribonuclease P protein component